MTRTATISNVSPIDRLGDIKAQIADLKAIEAFLVELRIAEQLGHSENAVQRRSQFVRHDTEELVLESIGALGGVHRVPKRVVAGESFIEDPNQAGPPFRRGRGVGAKADHRKELFNGGGHGAQLTCVHPPRANRWLNFSG